MQPQLQLEQVPAPAIATDPGWRLGTRLGFRFTFVYLALYLLPFPFGVLPFTDFIAAPFERLWHWLVVPVGKYVFGTNITIFTNGSGDTTYDWVKAFCILTLAAAAAIVWSILDRRRTSYRSLLYWTRLYVRAALGTIMISYGAVKVIQSQFPAPTLDRLIQSYGDASPMGLLWTFMGASASYNFFAGASEMIGGLLLASARTTALGALVSTGVLLNIFMLNMSYDVPVKLFSFHLLLMAMWLALPDARRIANLFLFNRPSEAADLRRPFRRKWLNYAAATVWTLFFLYATGSMLWEARSNNRRFTEMTQGSPVRGIWLVSDFQFDGVTRPPLVTDETRWNRMIFDGPQLGSIQLMSGSRRRYVISLDLEKKTLNLGRRDDPKWSAKFTVERPEPGALTMSGVFDGHQIQARLRRTDASQFLLTTRGFHWINEFPYNR